MEAADPDLAHSVFGKERAFYPMIPTLRNPLIGVSICSWIDLSIPILPRGFE
jgi:hypothetical protein